VPGAAPVFGGRPALSALFGLALAALFVAPAVLHLTAAVQTVLLLAVVPERAGISETVQTIAYATAPCVFAGLPSPTIRAVCTVYGAALLFVGLRTVHDTSWSRAIVAGVIPAAIAFGYAFRGFAALTEMVVWDGGVACFRIVELGAEVCVSLG
jgi:hypothetical protein